jgi:hypothetical protein
MRVFSSLLRMPDDRLGAIIVGPRGEELDHGGLLVLPGSSGRPQKTASRGNRM